MVIKITLITFIINYKTKVLTKMTSEEVFQRIAFLLWNDATLTDEAEKHCNIEGIDPYEYMKKLEDHKTKGKPGIIKTGGDS